VTCPPQVPLFLDDTVNSFYRRPDWSPDGSFLLLPCGQYLAADSSTRPTTYVCARDALATPCAHLPSPDKPVVAVRCCPLLFEHRMPNADAASAPSLASPTSPTLPPPEGAAATTPADSAGAEGGSAGWMAALPHRVLIAAATLDSVIVYDSSISTPLLVVSNVHYAPISDVAWLPDGHGVIVSATDGYCTLVRFRPGVLGTPLPPSKLPEHMRPKPKEAALPATTTANATLLQVRRKPKDAAPPPAPPPATTATTAPTAPTGAPVTSPPLPAGASATAVAASCVPPSATLATLGDGMSEAPAAKKPRRIAPTFVAPL
jgi:chromatin assembly factor 1 subunit B